MRKLNKKSFWDNVNKTDTCWLWTGSLFVHGGYGMWHSHQFAHRVAYEQHFGVKLGTDQLHHKCPNKNCINWDHMERTTQTEHPDSVTVINRKKTHCIRGHEFTERNTYIIHTVNGTYRNCRTCRDLASIRQHTRRKRG